MSLIRTNDDSKRKRDEPSASAFARQVLSRVGGSMVYIPPKDKKLVDTSDIHKK